MSKGHGTDCNCPYCDLSVTGNVKPKADELRAEKTLWVAQNEVNAEDNRRSRESISEQFQQIVGLEAALIEYKEDSDYQLNRAVDAEAALKAAREEVTHWKERLEAEQKLRPMWAQGFTSNSIAAQVSSGSLVQIFELLEVLNMTQAVGKVKTLQQSAKEQFRAGMERSVGILIRVGQNTESRLKRHGVALGIAAIRAEASREEGK